MKKFISLLLMLCMVATLIVLPTTAAGIGISSGSASAIGSVRSVVPVNITEFSYDETGNIGFVASNIPDDAIFYVGAFDENNRLLEVQEISLYNGSAYENFSAENVAEYRAYIWQNMKPLCKSLVAAKVPLVHKTITIPLSDLIDFDGEEVKYYHGDSEESINLASGGDEITFKYNGVVIGQYNDSDDLIYAFEDYFDIYNDIMYSGQLKLVDDGTANGYSIIDLEAAVSVVVDKVVGDRVKFKNVVMTTYGKTIDSLDFNSDDPEVVIELTKKRRRI